MARQLPKRRHPRLKAVGEWIAIGGAVMVLAIPYACLTIYSLAKYGKRFEQRGGCVRRPRGRRYTEEEWRNLKLPPKPELLILDLPETQQEREEREWQEERDSEDRIMGISERRTVPFASDTTWRKWKPKRPFRFMDLPREVQILVLENLVMGDQRKKWVACAGYCKDGFVPFHATNDPPLEHRPAFMKDELALWRAGGQGSAPMTRSLLLTSRRMRELTNAALACSFSGELQFHSRRRTSLLDAPWPWHFVTVQAPIVRGNKWLFDRIRMLETSQTLSAWPDLLSIMPNLEKIRLVPRNVYARDDLDEASLTRIWRTWEIAEYPHHSRGTAIAAAVEAGHHWMEWGRGRERNGQHTVAVTMVVRPGRSERCGRVRAVAGIEVQLCPEIRIIGEDAADKTVNGNDY